MARKSFRCCVRRVGPTALCLLILATAATVRAEDAVADTTRPSDTLTALSSTDTLLYTPPPPKTGVADVTNPVDLERRLTQSPSVALFKSLFVPGLGQLGNRRYFKACLFAGLEGWLIARAVHYGKEARDAGDVYDAQTDYANRTRAYYVLDRARKDRNKFIWFAGLTAFVSMFDAYVDAHLSGSPTDKRNEKVAFELAPDATGGVAASVTYRF